MGGDVTVASYEVYSDLHLDDEGIGWFVVTEHKYCKNRLGQITEIFHTYVINHEDYEDYLEDCCEESLIDSIVYDWDANNIDEATNNHKIAMIMLRSGEI